MYPERYIFDPLYGRIQFPDYIWKVLICPELQRLREVRLCNINSLCLSGGANVNRYEHSLGAAFLALKCLESWPSKVDQTVQRRIALAALLHDVGSPAFGHSVQYVLDLQGYKAESLYDIVHSSASPTADGFQYQHATLEPIYFGMQRRLKDLIADADLRAVSDMVAGHGPYGQLINGSIDLDNIDNVYRLSYHIGLIHSGKVPLRLARSIRAEGGSLVVDEEALPALEEWYQLRRTLYRYLLLNPEEFSAKCMLEEALELAQSRSSVSFNWYDVDFPLLQKLAQSSDDTLSIVSRLMLGDLYGCAGIYSTSKLRAYDILVDRASRSRLESELAKRIRDLRVSNLKNTVIALHAIRDVNKTQRQIKVVTDKGRHVEVGTPTRHVLVGAFFKNKHLSMAAISQENLEKWGVRSVLRTFLEDKLDDSLLQELIPYGEAIDDKD